MKRFEKFVLSVHPDPDHLFGKTVETAWGQISILADHYHVALGKTHCNACGGAIEKPNPIGLCVECVKQMSQATEG